MNLIFQAPVWFFPLCLLGGAAYAGILYYRERTSELKVPVKWILAGLRFLAVSLIAILLLSPLIKTNVKTVEKPVIILAQDNSSSLLMNNDSLFYKNEYPAAIKAFIEDLQSDFEVRPYYFSEKTEDGLKTDFKGSLTDISSMIGDIKVRYANRNVGAFIIASDGIYNHGNNPLYSSANISFPVYTIAMGDTNIRKDIILSEVNYNKVSYLGNSFPVEAVITAHRCMGLSTTMTVSRNGQSLFTKKIAIGEDDFMETVALTLDARQSGLQHYRVSLTTVEGEISKTNNVQDIYVDVLDARQKILILAAAPHPDITALRQSLELNRNYEVEVALQKDFNKPLNAYHLIILHQLPGKSQPLSSSVKEVAGSKVPVLYILGGSSDVNQINALNTGLKINASQNRSDESQAVLNNGFSMFTLSDEAIKICTEAPPLSCPYGDYKITPVLVPLFYQKIGKVSTSKPLILFSQGAEVRSGIICGEGIWRWRLYNYLQKEEHAAFDELIGKTIQFLSIKADKGLFRVYCNNRFSEHEQVQFTAELYNESYEMINSPEVTMSISDQKGKKFDFTFSRTTAAYHLNAGVFPPGDYAYVARVKSGNKVLQESGEFSVAAVYTESLRLVADHSLLHSLASAHKGEMVYPSQLSRLAEMIRKRDDIVSVSYSQKKFSDIINLFWVLLLIIGLLSTEWFIRKRGGAY